MSSALLMRAHKLDRAGIQSAISHKLSIALCFSHIANHRVFAMRKSVLNLLTLLSVLSVSGCATTSIFRESEVTSANNFRNRLTITHYDTAHFKLAISATKNGCFPLTDATPTTCVMPNIRPDTPVAMEAFEFKLTDQKGYISQEFSEFQHLAISEVALARGFSKYVITTLNEANSCGQTAPSAYTSGTMVNGTYTGSTTISSSTVCASLQSANVLMFNDANVLAQGVVYEYDGKFRLLTTLYRGALPTTLDMYSGPTPGIAGGAWIVPFKAWKSYYDAAGMAADLRKKHSASTAPYPIIEYRDVLKAKAEKDTANPLNKNKVSQ